MRRSRTRSIALCGLSIALLVVSAAISVPLGPVPFTLQTMVLVLICCVLSRREAIASVAGYLVLGAAGLPVFSGMRGGIAMIAGPTGGFLIGFLIGMIVASSLRVVFERSAMKQVVSDIICAVVLVAISYALGWVQLMFVAGLSAPAAFAAGLAPFIIPDIIKMAVAISIAVPVRLALGRQAVGSQQAA